MKTVFVVALAASSLLFHKAVGQQIEVRGGNPVLSITTAVVGSEPTAVVNTTSTLRYRRQNRVTKISVQTSCPSQAFTLKVVALSPQLGTAAPEVTLTNGMPATDFIVNIPAGSNIRRTARLQYTASTTFSQGDSAEMENDVHTVTHTLVRQ